MSKVLVISQPLTWNWSPPLSPHLSSHSCPHSLNPAPRPSLLFLKRISHALNLQDHSLKELLPQISTHHLSYLIQASGQASLYQEGIPSPPYLKQRIPPTGPWFKFAPLHTCHHMMFVYSHCLHPPLEP